MSDENHDAGPDAQGAQSSGGSDPSNEPTGGGESKVVLEAIKEMRDEHMREIQSLKNSFEQKMRHANQKKADPQPEASKGKELSDDEKLRNSMKEQLDTLKKSEEKGKIEKAFGSELKSIEGLAEGASDLIQESLMPYTKVHEGEVYVERGDKLIPLKEAVSDKAKSPLFRAPKVRSGSGGPEGSAPVLSADGKPLNFKTMSKDEFAKHRAQVKKRERTSFGSSS